MQKRDPIIQLSPEILKEVILLYVEKMDDLGDREEEIAQESLEICISKMKLLNELKEAILRSTDSTEDCVRKQCNEGALGYKIREAQETENGYCELVEGPSDPIAM